MLSMINFYSLIFPWDSQSGISYYNMALNEILMRIFLFLYQLGYLCSIGGILFCFFRYR